MELSNDLVARFVSATRDENPYKGETTAYGTIEIHGDSTYVRLDGSELLTPVVSTTDVNDGDRVIVTLKNHTATVTSNITDPAVGRKRADGMESNISQTASEIRLMVRDEVAKLEASITLTASEIRSEVSDEVSRLDSSITQTAGEIRTEISDEVSRLDSSITQTATSIRTEISNETSRLESSISQTAEEIRSEIKNEVDGLETSINQNSSQITTLVQNQNEFSEFKQTVEGFSFMDKGGTVKINHGDLNLTGSITFSDLDDDVEADINDATSTANTALTNSSNATTTANNAYNNSVAALMQSDSASEVAAEAKALAESIQLPEYLKETYIDSTTIMSPAIIGGVFYAVDTSAYTAMDASGLHVYTGGINKPKISLTNWGNVVEIVLGAGTYSDDSLAGQFLIAKDSSHAEITYFSGTYIGLQCTLSFDNLGGITVRRVNPDGTSVSGILLAPALQQ